WFAHLCLCPHVETLLRLSANQISKLLSFVMVDIDPVVSHDSASGKLHQFEGLCGFARSRWSDDDDPLARNVHASSMYRVGIPLLLHDCCGHAQCPALALSVVFCVEEY